MARSDRHFKATFNACLDLIKAGRPLVSDAALARELSVSRTMVANIKENLCANGILSSIKPPYEILREPRKPDYFDLAETLPTRDAVQYAFMNWVVSRSLSPGAQLSEADLARQLQVSPPTIREFLIGLSRYGFVRKVDHRCWVLEGFTRQYALEFHEVRVLFERRAVETVCRLPDADPFWEKLLAMRDSHLAIDAQTDFQTLDFAALDGRFHRLINSSAGNRIIEDFQDAIALIFHYHYLWNDDDLVSRNLKATRDHLAIIDAVLARDSKTAEATMLDHLETTHRTFGESVQS